MLAQIADLPRWVLVLAGCTCALALGWPILLLPYAACRELLKRRARRLRGSNSITDV